MSEKYLVIFTVGPVQSFIASARKTEDFWSGSYILSHLVREAIKYLYQNSTFELVFPVVSKEEIEHPQLNQIQIASLPNRFTALMEGTKEEIISTLKSCEKEVKESFQDIVNDAIKTTFENINEEQKQQLFKIAYKQVDVLLETYWIAEPYNESQSFNELREQSEKRLGALKNEKIYPQIEQVGFSCTVCNERDALCIEEIHENDQYGEINRKINNTWRHYKARKDNEHLCGVCLGKRLARHYFKKYFKAPLCFDKFESVTELTGEEQGYYAIFMMDGDNMGKWLKGDNPTDYSKTSKKLAHFAKDAVPTIVENQFKGQLIYAGGDDVLAFLRVEEALEAAKQLRFAFSDNNKGLGQGATASAGLIIAHTKTPLQHVLNEVRKLEKKAKSYVNPITKEEKNAIAIAVHTRSGEISETVLPWTLENHSTIDILKSTVKLLTEQLSSTFIFRFMEAFSPLVQTNSSFMKLKNDDMLKVEMKRLLLRSKKDHTLNQNTITNIVDQLNELHKSQTTTMDFIFLLKMLTFFARKEEK